MIGLLLVVAISSGQATSAYQAFGSSKNQIGSAKPAHLFSSIASISSGPVASSPVTLGSATSSAASGALVTGSPFVAKKSSPLRIASPAVTTASSFGQLPLRGQRGVTVSVSNESNFAAKVPGFLQHLAGLGVNSLSVLIWFQQSTYTSSDPALTSYSATPQDIQALISGAHQYGMSVMIRPIMDDGNIIAATNGVQWRGTVLPADPTAWFNAYTNAVVLPYASLPGIDSFDIGSELTTLAFTYPDRWSGLIATLRGQFPALRLTYSSGFDWTGLPGQPQPYPSFAASLDLLGVDAFFPLNGVTNGYIPGQLVQAWQPWLSKMQQLGAYYRRAIVFTEIGLASQCCTLTQPFVYVATATPNMLAQSTYYQAACEAIRPYHIGLYWWAYDQLDALSDPLNDNSFSPYGKPAEQEMARCYTSGY